MRLGFTLTVIITALLFWQLSQQWVTAAPHKVAIRKAKPMYMPFAETEAYSYLNSIRHAMGLQTLSKNDQLATAAQAHADYLVVNNRSSHYETEGETGFTGIQPVDRSKRAGYRSLRVSENLSIKNPTAKSSVNSLMSAIYHRFGFLSLAIDEIGIGLTQSHSNSDMTAFVYLMGNSDLNSLCSDKSFGGYGKYTIMLPINKTT